MIESQMSHKKSPTASLAIGDYNSIQSGFTRQPYVKSQRAALGGITPAPALP
jgi:hypothetical protein